MSSLVGTIQRACMCPLELGEHSIWCMIHTLRSKEWNTGLNVLGHWNRRHWFKNSSTHNDQVLKLHASHWWIEPGSFNQCVIKVTWKAKDWNIEEEYSWILRNWARIFLSDTPGGTYNCHHLWEHWSEQRGVF